MIVSKDSGWNDGNLQQYYLYKAQELFQSKTIVCCPASTSEIIGIIK